jgi:hypothetical protein
MLDFLFLFSGRFYSFYPPKSVALYTLLLCLWLFLGYFRLEMKAKSSGFCAVFRSLIRIFAAKVAKILHLGIKKEQVSFVLRMIFRIFVGKSEIKSYKLSYEKIHLVY